MFSFERNLLAVLTFVYMICTILFQFLPEIKSSNIIIQSHSPIMAKEIIVVVITNCSDVFGTTMALHMCNSSLTL